MELAFDCIASSQTTTLIPTASPLYLINSISIRNGCTEYVLLISIHCSIIRVEKDTISRKGAVVMAKSASVYARIDPD